MRGRDDEWVAQRTIPWLRQPGYLLLPLLLLWAVLYVVVERFARYVVDVRAKNAQPTQELHPFSVGETAVSADFGRWREIGDICRVVRHVAEMSPTLPT